MRNVYILLTVMGLICLGCNMYSQNVNEYLRQMSNVPIQSPDVAALNKFIEFPISHFNGQVDVSLPLYEIQLKNITLPITLKYHTGGIRVSEEASWVGLGWALDIGGVISHQINGKDDHSVPYRLFGSYLPYIPKEQNEKFLDGYPGTCHYGLKIPNKDGLSEDIAYEFRELNYDGEPDLYMYNMGNYSGKFIYYQDKEIDLNCNNIIFKLFFPGPGDSIIAISPDGNTYKFKDIERSISVTGAPASGEFWDFETTRPKVTAYHLTEIISTNGEKIKFYYKTFKQKCDEKGWGSYYPNYNATPFYHIDSRFFALPPSLYENYSYDKNLSLTYSPPNDWYEERSISHTLSTMLQLEKIEFPNGTIEFEKGIRNDAYGFKLDKVNVKDTKGELIKSFSFNYDYFIAPTALSGQDVSTARLTGRNFNSNYPETFMKKRLKLISLSENNNNGTKEEKYVFNYDESTQLPYKTSFSQDFWGYYNLKFNKSLLPSYNKYASQMNMPRDFALVEGGNRDVDPNAIKAGMLKEIIYPTKGKAVFEFESNESVSPFTSTLVEKIHKTAIDIGVGHDQKIFNVVSGPVDISVLLLRRYTPVSNGSYHSDRANLLYAQMEKYNESLKSWVFNNEFLWQWDAPSTSYVVEQKITNKLLEPGKYRITANFPDRDANKGEYGINMAMITVTYDTLVTQNAFRKNYGGGLRIKKVTKADMNTNKNISTSYTYTDGVLATHPIFNYNYRYNKTYETGGPFSICATIEREVKYLMQNPIYPYSFSANGNHVGYKKVTETIAEGEVGRIDYDYYMSPDNVYTAGPNIIPGIPPTSYLTNGFLKSKTIYKKDQASPISQAHYQHIIINAKPFWGFKVSPGVKQSRWCNDMRDYYTPEKLSKYIQTNFYPIIQGKILVKSETELIFNESKIGLVPIQTISEYEYNNEGLIKLKKISDRTKSDFITETYKYPKDMQHSSSIYGAMVFSSNLLTPIVEKTINRNGNTTILKTNYTNPYKNIFVPSNVQVQIGSNDEETRLVYGKYDSFANLNFVTKDNLENVVYLWGYNSQYPIAEIRNATYADVVSKISGGQTTIDTIAAKNEPSVSDFTMINNLRTSLPDAFISTYTYKPLVGILTVTDPRGIIQYFNYDSFGRLSNVKDVDQKLIEAYDYNYINP